MTPEQKHQWIKDWVGKWNKANRAVRSTEDWLEDATLRRNFHGNGDEMDSAFNSAKEAFAAEGKKIQERLTAELREIEAMIEVKHV